MQQMPVKLGPLALLLTVLAISLATLSVLTFVTTRADSALSSKYGETVKTRYDLEVQGQEILAGLYEDGGAGLSEWEETAEGTYMRTLSENGSLLRMEIRPAEDGTYDILSWRQEHEWTADDDLGHLWQDE